VTGLVRSPAAKVEWMPGVTPATVNFRSSWVGSWTVLSSIGGKCRLRGFTSRRGRDDILDGYSSGIATLVLDNTDGALDEERSGSEVHGYRDGTPIRVSFQDPASGTWYVVFAGLLASGWESTASQRSKARTVQIDVVDWMGYAASFKGPDAPIVFEHLWNIAAAREAGNAALWWRGPLSRFPLKVTDPTIGWIWDFSGGDNKGMADAVTIGDPTLLSVEQPSMGGFAPLPYCVHYSGAYVSSETALSTSDSTWHVYAMFTTAGPSSVGRHIMVGRTGSDTGAARWSIGLTSTGNAFLDVRDSSGSVVGLLAVTGDFDDGNPHWIIGQSTNVSGGAISLITDLGQASGTLSGTPAGSGGFITTGAVTVAEDPIGVAELQYIARGRLRFVTAPFVTDGSTSGIHTTSFSDALNRLGPALNAPPIVQHASPPTISMAGWMPAGNYAATVQSLAQAVGGQAFMRRDGKLYMRGFADYLASSAYSMTADEYNVKARITDEETPPPFSAGTTPPTLRYESQDRSARTVDRVINVVITAMSRWMDMPSIQQYGERSVDYTGSLSTWADYATATDWARQIIAARKDPTFDIADVVLRPWGDAACTTFVLKDLELETKVMYGERDAAGNVVVDDLPVHVQGEQWDWTATDWKVTLRLASPIPAEA
jgi:hypothetical protein